MLKRRNKTKINRTFLRKKILDSLEDYGFTNYKDSEEMERNALNEREEEDIDN